MSKMPPNSSSFIDPDDFVKNLLEGHPGESRDPEHLEITYPFRVLKKSWQRLCLGPGVRPDRAGSIGWVATCPQGLKPVSFGGGGGYFPRPINGEISAL
jgi:hypothetical protein